MIGCILIDCWEPSAYRPDLSRLDKKALKRKQKFFINLVQNLNRWPLSGVIVTSKPDDTSHTIQNWLPMDCTTHLSTQREFFELRENNEKFKQIKHWMVAGTTWQVCVHLNDMGLCSFSTMMRQHPDLHFYGADWGFLKHNCETTTDEDFKNDLLTWINCGELWGLAPEQISNPGLANQHSQTQKFRTKYIELGL